MRICIDAGHGGQDSGAVGPAGAHEADITLKVAKRLERILTDSGISVYLTRNLDRFVPLDIRAKTANIWGADLLLSLHCNGSENEQASGFEVWTTKGETLSDPKAEDIFCAWLAAFPDTNGRRDASDGDSDKEANFAVLRLSKMPAVLVEMDFITNPDSEAAMLTDEWIDRAAIALARGVLGR